jgi:lipopolysaccharide/colanic/teichoic acid biosynthesis glycosyltransferase
MPVLVLVALAVKAGDGGPIFYSQIRIGKGFQPFRLWKFRTMVAGAERSGLITGPRDRRTTHVGRFLRQYKLDELPQLFNVLKADMQFVGNRPEVERYVNLFRAQYELLLQRRPGITDPASILYRHEETMFRGPVLEEEYVSQILPDKLRISIAYQQRRTFFSDLGVVLQTLFPSGNVLPEAAVPRRDEPSD